MATKQKLVYQDYRPLKKNEAGYVASKRLYISPSNGDIIGVGTFQRHAHKQAGTSPKKPKKASARATTSPPGTSPTKTATSVPGPLTKVSQKKDYNERLDLYVKHKNTELRAQGKPEITRGQAIQTAEFKWAYKILKNPKMRADKSPNSLLAQALTILGLREREWAWNVGDTPTR